jgi:outer membrane immunogenic protein
LKSILGLFGAALLLASPTFAADLPFKGPVTAAPAIPAYNWTSCYLGGFAGGAGGSDVSATEAVSQGGAIPAGTFYNPPGIPDSYRASASFIGGGTLGCNWQISGLALVLGLEGEIGFLRSHAAVVDPNSVAIGANDTFDSTTIGDWYGVIGPRIGWAAGPALFYAKGGVLFARVHSSVIDSCGIAPCGPGLLTATGSNTDTGWAAGAGIEYLILPKWTVKAEYLFLGLNHSTFAVCGPGAAQARWFYVLLQPLCRRHLERQSWPQFSFLTWIDSTAG